MPNTYSDLTAADLVPNKAAKATSFALQIYKNFLALTGARFQHYLGGSRQTNVTQVAAPQDAIDWVDVELDGTDTTGLTHRIRVELRAGAATAVTFKLRNVTTSVDMVLSPVAASCTGTSAAYPNTNNQLQSCTFTPTTGVNKYRLQIIPANTTDPVYGIGYIEIFA